MTYPSDVRAIYDRIPTAEQPHWIEGTSARWNGYPEFQRRPQPTLDWFARFMGQREPPAAPAHDGRGRVAGRRSV